MSACARRPVRVTGKAARMVDGHATEHQRHPASSACASTPIPTRRSVIERANASGSDARSSRPSAASGGVACNRPHGPRRTCTARSPAAAAGRTSLSTRSPTYATSSRPALHQLDDPARRTRARACARQGSPTTRSTSAGRAASTRPRLERLGLVPDDPGAEPDREPAEAVERVRVQILQRVGLLRTSPSAGRSRDGPRAPCALPLARSSMPSAAPDDMRLQPAMIRQPAPPALLSSTSVSPTSKTTAFRATTRRARGRQASSPSAACGSPVDDRHAPADRLDQ